MPGIDYGVYILVIDLEEKIDIKVGRLGHRSFSPGKYLYVGRAKKYLNGRLRRHLRKNKKKFWHIDYLLQHAELEEIWLRRGSLDECQTAAMILSVCPEAACPVRGFGSSDCRCPSHLMNYSGQARALPRLRKTIEFEKAKIHGNQT
jgi:sugar fermentation stimulation protein A